MKVLIVSARYLGDSLLAASLAKPIKDVYPTAQVDVLTFKSNRPILKGVKGVDNFILVEQRPSKKEQAKHLLSLWNQYDWALITQQSTRASLYAYFAAKRQSVLTLDKSSKGLWKRLLLTDQVPSVGGHWLDQSAQLLRPILGEVPRVSPQAPSYEALPSDLALALKDGKYVVCHTQSRYQDKNWSVEGWRHIVSESTQRGYKVVFTGGRGQEERLYIDSIIEGFSAESVFNEAGKLSFNQTAELIRSAKVYVGVDTATSHVASATGTPCVCLYGPTNVTVWGPSPLVRMDHFSQDKSVQTLGNVTIVRNEEFLHCGKCSRHRCPLHEANTSLGHCLQTLPPSLVWSEVQKHL